MKTGHYLETVDIHVESWLAGGKKKSQLNTWGSFRSFLECHSTQRGDSYFEESDWEGGTRIVISSKIPLFKLISTIRGFYIFDVYYSFVITNRLLNMLVDFIFL